MEKRKTGNLQKKVIKTMGLHGMIEEGDNLMVGLSGGKDSLVLLDILGRKKKSIPFSFNIVAVHIDTAMDLYRADVDFMEQLCKDLDVEFKRSTISFSPDPSGKKSMCFLCSWHRRKRLFELAKSMKCNKLALGHHMNDAVETLLMNMIYHGSISSLPHKLSMFDGRMELIRPLLDLTEDQVNDYAVESAFPKTLKVCPHDDKTKRKTTKEILEKIESTHPLALKNIFRSMDKFFPEYLPKRIK